MSGLHVMNGDGVSSIYEISCHVETHISKSYESNPLRQHIKKIKVKLVNFQKEKSNFAESA